MKQSILRKLILIAVLSVGSHAFAHDLEVNGIYYDILSETDRTVEVSCKGGSCEYFLDEYKGSVVIPKKVTYNSKTYTVIGISGYAFKYCTGLTSITIPNSVTSIGYCAFSECSSLSSITIPNSVINIGGNVFEYCSNLNSIIVVSGNTVYDSRDNCNAIIKTATNNLEYGCKNTIIPNSISGIRSSAFSGCKDLKTVIIPNSVTRIGYNAFEGCSGLKMVTIGNSVTEIGDGAFRGCNNLTEIQSNATNPPSEISYSEQTGPFTDRTLEHATLYVPKGSKKAYESVDPWRNFWNIEEKEFSDIELTLVDNEVRIFVENGNIVVNGAGAKVEVYSVNGQCVYSGTVKTIPVTEKGMYIVKIDSKSYKVIL